MGIIKMSICDYLRDKQQNKNLNLVKYKFKFTNLNEYCIKNNLNTYMMTIFSIIENGTTCVDFIIRIWKDNKVKIEKFYLEEEQNGTICIWNDNNQYIKTYSNIVYYIDEILNKLIENNIIHNTHKIYNGIPN